MHVMIMIINAWDHTQGLGNLQGGGGDLPAVYSAKVLYSVLDTELLRSRPLADTAKACGIINNLGK